MAGGEWGEAGQREGAHPYAKVPGNREWPTPCSAYLSYSALQTGCLSQLQSGLFLYQGLLQALAGISPELSPTVDMLQLDVANFATTVWQQVSPGERGK